ncbi:MAG: hypothetical protein JXB50_08775 [Spirochaetes bacterium]|nr:hypothetical protein [Spirochaetota bacterium]
MRNIIKSLLIITLSVIMIISFTTCKTKDDTKSTSGSKKSAKYESITDFSGWTCYTGDSLPLKAGFGSVKDPNEAKVTIVKDKEIPGNNLLKFEGPGPSAQFEYPFSADYDTVTLVLRVKATGTAKRSWEVEVRNKGVRDKVRQELGKVNLERSKDSIDFKEDGNWHIWRIVMVFGANEVKTTVYMDESNEPSIVDSPSSDSGKPSRLTFGDGSGSEMYGCYYDWIAWRTDGAFKPSDKPLPSELTGIKK